MIHFSCPGCQVKYELSPSKAGKKFNCECGQRLQVPAPPRSKTVLGELVRDEEIQEEPAPKRKSSRASSLLPHRGIAVMVMGIVSVCLAFLGLFTYAVICFIVFTIAGLVLGLLSWKMGGRDLRQMRKGKMDQSGQGQTKAGYVCGIVGTLLAGSVPGVFCCCLMPVYLAAISTANMNSYPNRPLITDEVIYSNNPNDRPQLPVESPPLDPGRDRRPQGEMIPGVPQGVRPDGD